MPQNNKQTPGFTSGGDKNDSNNRHDSPSNRSTRRNNNNGRNRSKNNKPKEKPLFIGANTDKIVAVVADEPGLDSLSLQLEKLEKEIIVYTSAEMTATVATSIRTSVPYDFERSPHFPKPVVSSKYLIKKSDKQEATTEIDEAGKAIQERILESKITS